MNNTTDFADLVSIIMPSYNCGQYLRESIGSVLAQTYTNWELLFVDDGSIDDTEMIMSSYKDSRIRYFKNDPKCGAAESRNRALREAKGRWIAFLDSDDKWFPQKLEHQLEFMNKNNYHFSYTTYKEMDVGGHETGVLVAGPKRISEKGMYAFCWPGCLTVMYDVEKVGLIQVERLRVNNDYAMWLKASHKADCYLLNECLAVYRRGRSGSVSSRSYSDLIRWHYHLFRDADGKSRTTAIFLTFCNLIFGAAKKVFYVHSYKPE